MFIPNQTPDLLLSFIREGLFNTGGGRGGQENLVSDCEKNYNPASHGWKNQVMYAKNSYSPPNFSHLPPVLNGHPLKRFCSLTVKFSYICTNSCLPHIMPVWIPMGGTQGNLTAFWQPTQGVTTMVFRSRGSSDI